MTTNTAVGGELIFSANSAYAKEAQFAINKQTSLAQCEAVTQEVSNSFESPDFLPSRVMKAIALAYESRFFNDLSITTRQVLAALIRFSLNDKNMHQLAYVKKETLARHVGVSEATVYRALSTLEGQGLIEREKQLRTRMKLQNIGRIRFTLKLLGALGFLQRTFEHAVAQHRDNAVVAGASSRTSDNLTEKSFKSMTYKPPSIGSKEAEKNLSERKHAFKTINGKAVPSDLAWLAERNALAVTAIFKLMKAARAAGKRLSDVVAVTKHALQKLQGKELYAYLSSLLSKDVDFTFIAKEHADMADQEQQRERKAAETQNRISQLAVSLRGKKFELPDGSTISVDEVSVVVRRGSFTSSTPLHAALGQLEALASGQIASLTPKEMREPDRRSRNDVAGHLAQSLALLRQQLPASIRRSERLAG
ncbi:MULTISPECIES: helix-turn-helix domain-containing protein [unclassified Cupriavidus]|uniref:helix-turn-helix transcriptional regulator n=1 Tax=unclassified Cupriavidus TaxID=2640874 RepID=UPI0010F66E1C|nr:MULTISPECIES: helix-turn-helix domain-containing protein [unclassified Cupriavidus]MWL92082.1 helix-turn-helix domain-containing protein [Cupriavidus sp. SW-Y-13]